MRASFALAGKLAKYGSAVWIVDRVMQGLGAFAGQETKADVVIRFLGQGYVAVTIMSIATAGSIIYGVAQGRLARRDRKRLGAPRKAVEVLLDPNRSSSHLLPSGDTRPEDEEP